MDLCPAARRRSPRGRFLAGQQPADGLIEPIEPEAREAKIPDLPMVCRWLRGSVELERLVAHFDLMTDRVKARTACEVLPDSFEALRRRIEAATLRDAILKGLLEPAKVDAARLDGPPEETAADVAQ